MRTLAFPVLALSLCGCASGAREARAVQPNPLVMLRSPEEIPTSVTLYIYQRDGRLPHEYQLRSSASFAAVARDRLRFHVGVARYDESEADTRSWTVWLEDAEGHRFEPEAREAARMNRVAMNWILYPYSPTARDGWCKEPPCYSRLDAGYTAYEGRADYVFHEPDLMGRDRTMLSLVLERGGVEMRYTWRFADGTAVEHYGRSHVDDELGTIAVP